MAEIHFIREGRSIKVEEGTTILEAQRMAGLEPDAPCGGQGTCGKCLVHIKKGPVTGVVKACAARITGDMWIDTLTTEKQHTILAEGVSRPVVLDPMVRFGKITIPKVVLGDNLSQWERLTGALKETFGPEMEEVVPDLELSSRLYGMLRQGDSWYAAVSGNQVLELSREKLRGYLAAFDLGTTTVVGYLMDAETGKVLQVESTMNPQAQYGADVIMRADYALEHGTEILSSCVRKAVGEVLEKLAAKAQIPAERIYQVCVAGNTCMHHLFLNISPDSLVHAPYNPAISQLLILKARDYGLKIHEKGQLILLPNVAGFVGADTMGCILCTRPDLDEKISLMIDIGTNGEMVLGNREKLAACSTAAGPAFEGAKIQCGMRGAAGAVDHVTYKEGTWKYTTVGGEKAVGICGSGLIDVVACLRKAGMLDEMGALEVGGEREPFVLVPAEESGNKKDVFISQKDIREVQLAKAAIAAGIRLLEQELGITEEQIDTVYLAGAFGNYMDAENACCMGLIPAALRQKIHPIGNAAGEGAKIALLNKKELQEAGRLAEKIQFVELATSPEFQDCFVDELEFPELPESLIEKKKIYDPREKDQDGIGEKENER